MYKMKEIRFTSVETMCTSSLQRAFLILCLFSISYAYAQIPQDYYTAAEGKNGYALRVAMHNIIKNHTSVSYGELWNAFYTTDKRPDNGKVWDLYSDRPGGTPSYYFTFGSDQCGNYSGEGDCYNREHSVPKSWFGGSVAPMYTDLFHLYPTDGFVNSKRGNLPVGKVINATWTSTNGSKVGTSNISGYSGQVFEPIDSFKGDFARTYFYMAVCYMNKNLGVETQSNFSGGNLKPWAKELLLQWAALDPVSQKEIARNNAVFQIQHNRNPFIDFPELADMIFGSDTNNVFTTSVSDFDLPTLWAISPNPTTDYINIQSFDYQTNKTNIEVIDMAGKPILSLQEELTENYRLDVSSLSAGIYLLRLTSGQNVNTFKIVKQ
jgi:endonuclease I